MSRVDDARSRALDGNKNRTDGAPPTNPSQPESFGRATSKQNRKRDTDDSEPPTQDQAKEDFANEDQDTKENPPEKQPLGPKKPPFYKRPIPLIIIFLLVGTAIVFGTLYYLHARQFESTDDAFIDGHTIPISPQVAARVLEVRVDDNRAVKKGDVLVVLDPADYQVVLDQKQADELSARSKVEQARAQLVVAKANVTEANAEMDVAKTNAENAQRDLDRFNTLDPRARSQQQLDNATSSQRGSAAMVEQAQAKIEAASAQVLAADSAIKTAQDEVTRAVADTHQAQINLAYCNITAPEDGIVTKKNVEPGMYLSLGQNLLALVPTYVWVTANFKETQLDLMRVGQSVSLKVDAYPEKEFHGTLDSIQNGTGSKFTLLPPENATGNFVKVVQRVPVKIVLNDDDLHDRDHLLAPGMSVEPEVKIR